MFTQVILWAILALPLAPSAQFEVFKEGYESQADCEATRAILQQHFPFFQRPCVPYVLPLPGVEA